MKLLVTGGLGFIGSNFVRYYLMHHPDDTIINLDKQTYASSKIASNELAKYQNYRHVLGDICDEQLLMDLTEGIETIIHFAAETLVDQSVQDPPVFANTNILGTFSLLKAARKNRVKRFHHISIDEVFGSMELGSKEKFSETTRYNPRNRYSASKAAADFNVRMYHETFGLETTITICSNNFGPYQHPEKLIPKAILNALSNRKIPIYGDGKDVRDWLYVEDHCSAIDLVLRKGQAGESYCISAGNETSNVEIITMLLEIMGKSNDLIQFVPDRLEHDTRYALDATKIKQELGWKPQYDFREALTNTVQWYKEHKQLLTLE